MTPDALRQRLSAIEWRDIAHCPVWLADLVSPRNSVTKLDRPAESLVTLLAAAVTKFRPAGNERGSNFRMA